jgi:hypothetical protein
MIGLGQRQHPARDQSFDFFCGAHVAQQQQEFIATGARHRVRGTGDGQQPVGHVLEQRIACAMAQRIVDDFETIQIEDAYCEWLRLSDGALQLLDEQHPVGDAGEGVVRGLPFQFQIHLRQRFVALFQHAHRLAQLPAAILQPHAQATSQAAQQYASPESGNEAQQHQCASQRGVLRNDDARVNGQHGHRGRNGHGHPRNCGLSAR